LNKADLREKLVQIAEERAGKSFDLGGGGEKIHEFSPIGVFGQGSGKHCEDGKGF